MKLWRRWRARRHQRAVDKWVKGVLARQREDPWASAPTHAQVLQHASEAMDREAAHRDRPRRRTHQREQPWAFYGP